MMLQMFRARYFLFIAGLLLSCAGAALPAAAPWSGSDSARQSFTFYLWVPGMWGDVTVRGNPAEVNESIGDTWSNIFNNSEGVFTGHYEYSKYRWNYFADLLYLNLVQEASVPQGLFEVDTTQTIGELGVGYSVAGGPINPEKPYNTEIIVGGRYTHLSLDITDQATGISDNGSQTWVDPFIGVRHRQYISPLWAYSLRGDIGGFDIGNASRLTWNAVAQLGYVPNPHWSYEIGWRWLDYDYSSGAGATLFEYDVLNSGPLAGVTYYW